MARISDRLLMQQHDGRVVLFEEGSEIEFARFFPAFPVPALESIKNDPRLSQDEIVRASFWAGYFYAHATK